MKIGPNLDTAAAAETQTRGGRVATTSAAATTSATSGVDQVALSAAGAQIGAPSSDFDSKKVDAIRQAIKDGRFTVNAGAIADRLIADAAALLAPRTGA